MDKLTIPLACDRCGHDWDFSRPMEGTVKDLADRLEDVICPKCAAGYEWQSLRES